MTMIRTLFDKPWLSPSDNQSQQPESVKLKISAPQLAMRFLMTVITILFLLFTITFISRTQLGDFQALSGEPWLPLDNPLLLWINTGILFFASLSMQWAIAESRVLHMARFSVALVSAVALSLLFLFGQIWVWLDLVAQGYYVYSNPANSYFYLFTGVHGLHLIGGLIALGWVVVRFLRRSSVQFIQSAITLCTHYWHFLFLIWLALFAMLTSSAETFDVIARLCGF